MNKLSETFNNYKMRKLFVTFTLAILAMVSFSQIPQTMSYQGVVRDADNKLVADKQVTVSVQILQGTDDGTAVYSESHEVTTNANGLMTFELGSKDAENFSKIDWSNAPYFVKTVAEFDGKQIQGVTPLLAVPYALYAAKAGSADVDLSNYATKGEIPSTEGFATKEDLNALNIPSVEGLASESYVNEKVAAIEIPSTEGLASESYVDEKVAEIDLSNYYLKSDVDALLAELNAKIKKLDKELHPIVGTIEFAFSVSKTKKVYFSQGNLQYQASTGTWRFAENQWNFVGNASRGNVYENEVKCDNANISENYEGWIDLFGWGTSGYNGKNPYMTSTDNSDYGDGKNDIAGTNYDWGVYNAISNGGNQAGQWRTLTHSEWEYVINSRASASSKKGVATVNDVTGIILLPDNWIQPDGLTFTSGANGDFAQNIYSSSEWSKMEANGAVFLPATGNRYYGTEVVNIGYGYYWSGAIDNDCGINYALAQVFRKDYVGGVRESRSHGNYVRLVREVEE